MLFLDTDNLPALEVNQDERIQNPKEAELVHIITEALCASGVAEECIGVISVYRAQLKLLNMKLKKRPGIEVLTADRSQGRDKDCVIISLVRANDSNTIGDLLRDWRRLNVTFTRAKSKLIIVGSRRTLECCNVLKAFLEVIDENRWAYKLPRGADNLYQLPSGYSLGNFSQGSLGMQLNSSRSPSKHKSNIGNKKRIALSSPTSSPKKSGGESIDSKRRNTARNVFKASPAIKESNTGGMTRDIFGELGVTSATKIVRYR